MARLAAAASGLFSSSGTWVTFDAATALVTEGGASRTALTTSSQNSANITPTSNITIDAIAIKVADVQGATGNLTLTLYNVTSTASVVSLTIPIADLPQGSSNTTGFRAGWLLFATGDQNLTSGSNYQVRLNVSSGSSAVGVMTNGTAANWQHLFRTKTAATPGSGDDLWVLGLWTASGTWTQYTVTMDSTSTATTYGSNPTGGTADEHSGLIIGKSTVSYGTTASTTYALKLAGRVSVGPGGVFSMGTSGTPMPATSTAQLMFATTNAVHGLTIFRGGQVYTYGASKTTNWTYLTADASSGSTASVSVANDTGWTSGSTCYLSATSQTYSQAAQYTLSGAASTASMAFTGALSAAYLGSGGTYPWPCHLVLTSYNVEITSDASTRYNSHICYGTGNHTGSWFKFTYGIYELNACTSNIDLQSWCIDFQATNPAAVVAFIVNGVCSGTWTIRNLVAASNIAAYFATIIPNNNSTVTSMTFDTIIHVGDGTSNQGFQVIFGPFAQVKRLRALGGAAAIAGSTWGSTVALPSDWLEGSWVHGSTGASLSIPANAGNITITDFRGITTSAGTSCIGAPNPAPNLTFVQCYFMGGSWLYGGGTASKITDWVFDRCYIGGLTAYSASMSTILSLFSSMTSITHMKFLGCVFDAAWLDGPTASLVDLLGVGEPDDPVDLRVSFVNCSGDPTTGVVSSSGGGGYVTKESFVSVNKWNQASGDHRVYKPFALNASTASSYPSVQTDATTYNTAAPSEKLTPKSASIKLESSVKRVAVASGATAALSVYVRKSAAYNGNAPRLILKRNDSAGTTADTVGDTHTAAADTWEQLTYTTPAAADDCVMEFVVDCDGTAGVVYVDDWAAT